METNLDERSSESKEQRASPPIAKQGGRVEELKNNWLISNLTREARLRSPRHESNVVYVREA